MTAPHAGTGGTPSDGTPADGSELRVVHARERHRWEALQGEEVVGFAHAREHDGVVEFDHTVVPPEFEGRGVASALARASLADARARGLRVRPTCSFYARWFERHPADADLRRPRPQGDARP